MKRAHGRFLASIVMVILLFVVLSGCGAGKRTAPEEVATTAQPEATLAATPPATEVPSPTATTTPTAHPTKADLERAIADYDRAIALKPEYAKAYYNRGSIRYSEGDVKASIADFERVLELTDDPDLLERAHAAIETASGKK